MKTVFKGFICMNNTRYEVFFHLHTLLENAPQSSHNHIQLKTFVEMTLEYLKDNYHSVVFDYKVTKNKILSKIQDSGLPKYQNETSDIIDIKKIRAYLDKIVNEKNAIFYQLGYKVVLLEEGSNKGGRHNSKHFWLDIEQIEKVQVNESIIQDKNKSIEETVSYHKNNIEEYYSIKYERKTIQASLFAKLFFKDNKLKLIKPLGILLFITLGLLFFLNISFAIYVSYYFIKSIIDNNITLYKSFIYTIALISTYLIHKNFFRELGVLVKYRVIKAPMIFIGWDTLNADIECYVDQVDEYKVYHLTEITATCPICTAPIILADGKPDQKAPLVGRCKEAPHAHVYSFDRMTMKGYFLGHQGYLIKYEK